MAATARRTCPGWHDKAGERILEGLVADAEKRLHDEGIAGEIYLFKNNTDSAGNSYGCHENYLVSRHGEFGRLADVLIPFLVTRQLICGAGKVLQTPRVTVDWVHLKLNDQAQRTVLCKDPFRAYDERVERLIASM